jgi:ribosomal protein S18 acetylase RimI-like enzyme
MSSASTQSVVRYATPLVSDAPALSDFFSGLLPITYPPDFYKEAVAAPTFFTRVAVCAGRLVGAIVVKTWDLAAVSGPGKQLPFDLLAGAPEPGAAVACVLLLAVGPTYRRLGVGSQLLQEGLGAAVGGTPGVRAAFLMCRAGDAAAHAFYCGGCALPFAVLGRWPGYYPLEGGADASVLALPFKGAELAEFEGVPPANLLDPAVKRKRRMPAWQRTLLLYYVLPFAALALLFALSYALVALGPLRGISGPHTGRGAPRASPTPQPTIFAARRGGSGGREL